MYLNLSIFHAYAVFLYEIYEQNVWKSAYQVNENSGILLQKVFQWNSTGIGILLEFQW